MAEKAFTRGQTQILYRYLPGAIFDHDDYGLCRVDEITTTDPGKINRRALFDALYETLHQWDLKGFCPGFPDPRQEGQRRRFKIGQPDIVHFSPFPRVLQCRKCRHVAKYDDLRKRTSTVPGRCPRPNCGGRLSQLRYVEIHNCGRIEEMHVPERGCPVHGKIHLRFFDPGRAQKARWVCGECGREIQKARMTPCNCDYSGVVKKLNRPQYEQFLRLYPTGEPGVYMPQVLAFINFSEEDERRLIDLEDGHVLMLARLWGLLTTNVISTAHERQKWMPSGATLDPALAAIVESLRQFDPDNPALQQYEAVRSNPPGQEAIDAVLERLADTEILTLPPSRRLIEHIALQDSTNHTDVAGVVNRLRARGAEVQAAEFDHACTTALQELGLRSVKAINDFPIAMAAVGYTRVTGSPNSSILSPFSPDADGKTPLFVLPAETEGLWVQLDPIRVTRWLLENDLLSGPMPSTPFDAWAHLYQHILGRSFQYELIPHSAAQALVFLIHTLSHVLLQRIEWSGFSPSSVGEYLFPETLSFVLYANRFAETKIGGLTTLFEQRLPLWLRDAAQTGCDCMYDPLCGEEGGSCAGCLHREHNCSLFNHQLSRAVLYGGYLPIDEGLEQDRIRHGYWRMAQEP